MQNYKYSREILRQQVKSEPAKFATPTPEWPQMPRKIAKIRSKIRLFGVFPVFSRMFLRVLELKRLPEKSPRGLEIQSSKTLGDRSVMSVQYLVVIFWGQLMWLY